MPKFDIIGDHQVYPELTSDHMLDINFPRPKIILVRDFGSEDFGQFISDLNYIRAIKQPFIPLVIDTYGGEVHGLMGMIDALDEIDLPVHTMIISKAMSAGAVLFSMGNTRHISPNSSIMIHHVISGAVGKEHDIRSKAEQVTSLNDRVFSLLDKSTNKSDGFWKNEVKNKDNSDLYLNARQALDYGLATHIGIPKFKMKIEHSFECIS